MRRCGMICVAMTTNTEKEGPEEKKGIAFVGGVGSVK